MDPLRVCYISFVICLVLLTKQANSEQDKRQKIPASIDLLFQHSNPSQTKGGTAPKSQSAFKKCPPCRKYEVPRNIVL